MVKKVLLLIFVLYSLPSVVCFSQSSILDKKISLSIQNKSIAAILETMEKKGGFTFSYNNSILDENKRGNISVSNTAIKAILLHIFGNDYQFTLFNNQILISLKQGISLPKQAFVSQKKASNKQILDTIHVTVTDTIRKTIIDTQFVKVIDTVIFNDTIFVTQTKAEKLPKTVFFLSTVFSHTLLTQSIYDFKRKYIDIKRFIDNAESKYTGYDAGFQVDFNHKNIRYRTGIGISKLTKNISYSFEKEYIDDGSVFIDSTKLWQYHTILYYFKFKDGDTIKVPVIDSSQVYKSFEHTKRHIENKKTFGTNTISLMQIPLSIGYSFSINKKTVITPFFSTKLYVVTMQQGFTYNNETGSVDSLSKHNSSQFFVSAALSFQYEYRLNKATTIFIEPTINQFINPMFHDNRKVNERLFQCSAAFGLRTHLFSKK